MTVKVLIGMLCILVSSANLLGVQAVVSSMGTVFMIATPRLMPGKGKLTFFLVTWKEELFKVSIGGTWYTAQKPLKDVVTLSRTKPVDYPVSFEFISTLFGGRAWCYKLEANFSFSLTVLMEEPGMTKESFQVVPVAAWGKTYLIFSLQECPSIQMITAVNQTLMITKSSFSNSESRVMKFSLVSGEAYSLAYHKGEPNYHNLSGAMIEGEYPFGLVSGTCEDYAIQRNCALKDARYVLFTEMLLANESLGREFIGLFIPLIYELTEFYIMAGANFTRVFISTAGVEKEITLHLGEMHVHIIDKNSTSGFRIYSTYPIQVVLLQLTPCLETVGLRMDKGDSSLSLIIPNDLFYVQYIWRTPHNNTIDYATIVIERTAKYELKLNSNPITTGDSEIWYNVSGNNKYQITHVVVPKGANTVLTKTASRFGCYLMGKAYGVFYMHPVGFQDCPNDVVTMDDQMDNDCDGLIDEEIEDKQDNDNDTKIDEDTRTRHIVNGNWGPWEAWNCNFETRKHRKRFCNDPPPTDGGHDCDGDDKATSNVTCKPKDGQWGSWQEWSCDDRSRLDKRFRIRNCDSPAPEDGGLYCQGNEKEDDNKLCAPVDGGWSLWTEWACNPNISAVIFFRKRLCNNPTPHEWGDFCRGHNNESKIGQCTPIDGHWGQWTTWVCVDDTLFKTRHCNNPRPKDGGRPCPDKQNKTKERCQPDPDDHLFEGFNAFLLLLPMLMLVPICILSYMIFQDRRQKREQQEMDAFTYQATEETEQVSMASDKRKSNLKSQSTSKGSLSRTTSDTQNTSKFSQMTGQSAQTSV